MKYLQPSAIASALRAGGLSLISMVVMGAASAPLYAETPAQWQAALQQTRLSLAQAIDAAEKAVAGRAFDAQLDIDDGSPHFEIDIITTQGDHVEVHVNAGTGAALQHKNKGSASSKDRKRLDASKITLKQALDAALRHTPGTAVDVELGNDWGRAVIAVDVLTAAGQRMEIKVNPADGSVISAKAD
ncbi:PepSY domain-containing protein [Pantoea sp. 18069]|uniref:PepSY domain-containing protein n=1 Tax=Pantoea sp. 18069 TaxID=2681415 RepID=UPI00135BC3FF|nr:PepSY domain-containing protein [Pantoea sp. 18069]